MIRNFSLIFLIYFCSVCFSTTRAQLDPRFTQNIYLNSLYNPATVGFNEQVKLTSANRTQWIGSETYFTTNFLQGQWKSKSQPIGFGITILSDLQGVSNLIGGNCAINYRIHTLDGLLSFGLSTGFLKSNKSYNNLLIQHPSDQILSARSKVGLDLGFGTFYKLEKTTIGFSVTHINQPSLIKTTQKNVRYKRNYYLHFVHLFQKSWGDLHPSAILKLNSNFVPQLDLSLTNVFKNNVICGILGRSTSEYAIIFGYTFQDNLRVNSNALTISYSYENAIAGQLQNLTSTHEIVLQLLVGKRPNPDQIRKQRTQISPLFF